MKSEKFQFKIKNFYLLVVALSFALLAFSFYEVKAAQLNLVSPTQEIGIDQQFQVDLILNTEGEEINAVEGKILFPKDLLELKEIRDGNSIINFWIERPSLNSKSYIPYSGIIPGGYIGERGLVFSIIFQSKNEGEGMTEIHDAKTLLNDGKGTPTELSISNFQFLISKLAPTTQFLPIKDTEPPESFKPMISQDPKMFDGKYFLVFATQDKESGIAGYAIHESTRKKEITRINTKEWKEAESPYVLKDQKLRSFIYVKAIDKAGNERIAVVEPNYPIRWYEIWWVCVIIIIGIIIGIVIGYTLWRIKRRKSFSV